MTYIHFKNIHFCTTERYNLETVKYHFDESEKKDTTASIRIRTIIIWKCMKIYFFLKGKNDVEIADILVDKFAKIACEHGEYLAAL